MKRSIILLFTLITIILPITGASQEKHTQPINIGALLCLSGNCSDWGTAALKGAQLAVKEINAAGEFGYHLELRTEDTRESINGAQAVAGFQKLVSLNDIHFIIGPSWSPGALAVAPLAAQKKELVVLTPSASSQEFNRAGVNLFNMRPVEDVVTTSLAQFAVNHGWKRAAILASNQPAEMAQGKTFSTAFTQAGGSIIRHIETDPGLADVKTEVLQIVAAKTDVVFLISYNQMNNAANNLRTLGYRGPILTISIDDARVTAAGGALEGVIVAKAPPPTAEFIARFEREYEEAPGLSAENGYDAVLALSKAITSAGSIESQKVASSLSKLKFSGAAGEVEFNSDRGVVQKPVFYSVSGGKLREIVDQAK